MLSFVIGGRARTALLCLPVALALTACGSGGGKSASSSPPATASADSAVARSAVPDVKGRTFKDAIVVLNEAGIASVRAASFDKNAKLPTDPDGWKVCGQDPAAGSRITAGTAAELLLAAPSAACA
ncbi:PASTA domain-containing protein [Actinomadura kijaniata]|uniref:PASTA domain-containing protein n=1 Tax=Actinomadura kijaniata TaxID=46161 RepID=UPI00082FFC1A|nr:PASTA domain-containing protein [Actinomadura kijaniata]